MRISSPAFAHGTEIPVRYTCDGENVAPPLEWSNVPDGAESLALVMDDPDAPWGLFTHWVVYDLPADVTGLPEGGALPPPAGEGQNDYGRTGYAGPCPPPGPHHRYYFRLFALDTALGLTTPPEPDELRRLMCGHILDHAELMGTYGRT